MFEKPVCKGNKETLKMKQHSTEVVPAHLKVAGGYRYIYGFHSTGF